MRASRHAVILAGGRGTRMGSLTDRTPKPLLPLAGEPIVLHQLRWLAAAGIADVTLAAAYRAADFDAVVDLVGAPVAEQLRADFAAAGPVDVVGHSMGGKIAMELALTEPDLVDQAKATIEALKARGAEVPIPEDVVVAKTFAADAPATVKAAKDVAETARDKAADLADQAKDKTADLADKAKDAAQDAQKAAGNAADQAKDKAAQVADRAKEMLDQAATGDVHVEGGWGQGRATFGGLVGGLLVSALLPQVPGISRLAAELRDGAR